MGTNNINGTVKTHYGFVGWQLIIFAMLAYMVTGSFWGSSAVNVLAVQMSARLGLETTAEVLSVNTVVSIISVVVAFFIGLLYQKVKMRYILAIQFLLSALGLFLTGSINSLASYGIVYFIIYSMTYTLPQIGIATIFSKYMPTKKGTALGWATIGASMNNIIALPILNKLTEMKGIDFATMCFGIYLIILGILCFILWPDDPKKRNYLPDNGDISEEQLKAFLDAQQNHVENWTTGEILRNKNFWFIAIGYGLIMLVTVGIASQLVVFEVMNGISQGTAITIMSITAIGGILGSIASGYIDQKLGVKRAAMILAISYALSCLFAGYLPFNNVTNILFIFFYCVVMGTISNLPASHAMGCFGIDFSKAWKMIFPVIALISSFSGLLLGQIRLITGSYKGAYAVLMWAAIIACVLFALSDSRLSKVPGEKPVRVKDEKIRKAKEA